MCYRKCGHRPSQIPLCLIEPIFSTKNDRYNMVTYAFEKMQVAKLFIGNAAVCAQTAYARTTSLVIKSGGHYTSVAPIINCHQRDDLSQKYQFGGETITQLFLQDKILSQQVGLSYNKLYDAAQKIKESRFEVKLNHNASYDQNQSQQYLLPDHKTLVLTSEINEYPEQLFKHSQTFPGLPSLVTNTIQNLDTELQNELLTNIILHGGNTLFKGVPERLLMEVQESINHSKDVMVLTYRNSFMDRKCSAWLGASILTSLPQFKDFFIDKSEYQEYGANVVDFKCP